MIRIFVGSGNINLIETRVLEYSIRRYATAPVDITLMNGDEDCLILNTGDKVSANVALRLAEAKKSTPFTFYRNAIPDFCNRKGRAIYVDSDQLLLADIRRLWEMDMGSAHILLRRAYGRGKWATSVLLMDCEKAPLNLDNIAKDIARGEVGHHDLIYFTDKFVKRYGLRLGVLSAAWNEFDRADQGTNLVHFTNLGMQPWRYDGHPYEGLWVQYLIEAYKAGYVTREMLTHAVAHFKLRPELLDFISVGYRASSEATIRMYLRAFIRNVKFMGGLRPYFYNLLQA